MRHCHRPGPLVLLLGAMPLVFAAVSAAADLRLTPLFSSPDDIGKVVPRADGVVGMSRAGGIDLLDAGGTARPVARPSEGELLYLADDARLVGAVRHRVGAADFAPTSRFELRDMDGRVLWDTGETEDVTYAISAGGIVVGMSLNINLPEKSSIHFYDRGTIIAAVEVPYLEMGRFDPSGAVFLALSARDGLRAFDRSGSEIWGVPDVRLFAATDMASAVAVIGEKELRILRDGVVVGAADLGGLLVRRVAIAPDGGRVAIAGKHEIRVFDRSLALLWSTRTGSEDLSWTSVDVASADGYVMAGLARDLGPGFAPEARHPDGEIRAFDATGKLVHSGALTFPIWNIWTPTVLIDRSAHGATITTRRAVYRTVLP